MPIRYCDDEEDAKRATTEATTASKKWQAAIKLERRLHRADRSNSCVQMAESKKERERNARHYLYVRVLTKVGRTRYRRGKSFGVTDRRSFYLAATMLTVNGGDRDRDREREEHDFHTPLQLCTDSRTIDPFFFKCILKTSARQKRFPFPT
jgi:hypothetical protein